MGRLLEPCPIHGRRRVELYSPSLLRSPTPVPNPLLTVFRYDEDGTTRGDGQPSQNDLVNYDPEDGAVRINFDGYKVVCAREAA